MLLLYCLLVVIVQTLKKKKKVYVCGRGVGWGGEGRRNKSLGLAETLPTISLVVVLRNCTKMRNHRSSQQRHSEMFNISFAVKIYYLLCYQV